MVDQTSKYLFSNDQTAYQTNRALPLVSNAVDACFTCLQRPTKQTGTDVHCRGNQEEGLNIGVDESLNLTCSMTEAENRYSKPTFRYCDKASSRRLQNGLKSILFVLT